MIITEGRTTNLFESRTGSIYFLSVDDGSLYMHIGHDSSLEGMTSISELLNSGEIRPITLDKDGYYYSYDASIRTGNVIIDAIDEYMHKTNCYSGESLHQMDSGILEAPNLVSNIIDNILNVKYIDILND